MTPTGEHRARYASTHTDTDPRPSRFANNGDDYTAWAERADAWRLPDLDGYVHGIVGLNPPTVQCDGCGKLYRRDSIALAVLTSGIQFNPRATNDHRRMCATCWERAGWHDDNQRGFIPTELAR